MSYVIPGTDLIPWPVEGSVGIEDDACTAGSWNSLDAGTGLSMTVTVAPDGNYGNFNYRSISTDYAGDDMLAEIFGTSGPADSSDRCAYLEFTNQRNGERYLMVIWANTCE